MKSSELRALSRANFRLDESEPCVWLAGDFTKNREPAELWLRPATAAELKGFLAGRPLDEPVFSMPAVEEVVRMLRYDLE